MIVLIEGDITLSICDDIIENIRKTVSDNVKVIYSAFATDDDKAKVSVWAGIWSSFIITGAMGRLHIVSLMVSWTGDIYDALFFQKFYYYIVTAWQQNDNKVSGKYVEYIECVRKWTAFNVNINGVHSETSLYDRVWIIFWSSQT